MGKFVACMQTRELKNLQVSTAQRAQAYRCPPRGRIGRPPVILVHTDAC